MGEISAEKKNKIEVAYSPELFDIYFEHSDAVVVVIDVLRATSAICSAINTGVNSIVPVETVDEARAYQKKGYLVGAERKGQVVEGFDFGNSPFAYQDEKLKGKDVVLTTTNGTRAVKMAESSDCVIIGAFTNLSEICKYLEKKDRNVLLLCAGWKGRFNLEDTLFAGAVVERLSGENVRFGNLSDSAIAAKYLYQSAKGNLYSFLENSSHRRRLSSLNLEEDIIYCLTEDQTPVVPILDEGRIVEAEIPDKPLVNRI